MSITSIINQTPKCPVCGGLNCYQVLCNEKSTIKCRDCGYAKKQDDPFSVTADSGIGVTIETNGWYEF